MARRVLHLGGCLYYIILDPHFCITLQCITFASVHVIQKTMAYNPKTFTVSFRCNATQQAMINDLLKVADKGRVWGHTSQSFLILKLIEKEHSLQCK